MASVDVDEDEEKYSNNQEIDPVRQRDLFLEGEAESTHRCMSRMSRMRIFKAAFHTTLRVTLFMLKQQTTVEST